MKKITPFIAFVVLLVSCSTQKELSYLNNLDEVGGEAYFDMEVPDYKVQPGDLLYVSVKAQTPEGSLTEMLNDRTGVSSSYIASEASQYVMGYSIAADGSVRVPLLGKIPVTGLAVSEIGDLFQTKVDSLFRHAYVEVRLLSYKFTVLGEVRTPGSFVNYNDQLTVLEAIGRAGGITETGTKEKILVVRPVGDKTFTYHIDLQDKSLLSSPAYFITPNDVIIVQPNPRKVFSINLPTISFILTALTSTVSTTLLLVNYFSK